MKVNKITIHNFRSIKEQAFELKDYSLLIGANNAGKSNLIDALRIFYEKDLKFEEKRDFPKFKTDDTESWIEIEYKLTDIEFKNLKEEYKQEKNTLKVRKYLKSSETSRVKSNQSNIYGYEQGNLSNNLFYGAKNISEAKLGDVIYIPEITKIEEFTKLSGPSAFRSLLEFCVKKVIKNSDSFENLSKAFTEFNEKFKEESSKEGISLNNLIQDINTEIKGWNVSFGVNINPIRPEEIIKNLLDYYFEDKNLNNQTLSPSSFGQGLQRHFIYTLIKLTAKYKETPIEKEKNKKEFSPELTIILFEEPEAFLHPAQQEILNLSLKEISSSENQQVLISTHSPYFVSRNVEDLTSLLKLLKKGPETCIYQINEKDLEQILGENTELKEILGEEQNKTDIEWEHIKYSLVLDPDRCCAFFSDKVLICEGLTEKALLDCLIKEGKLKFEDSKIYILNAAGKYDIHRYMNLFGRLGIYHSVLFDGDENRSKQEKINEFIKKNKNDFTIKIHQFDNEFEDFLEIPKENERYKKPLNVMWNYKNDKISKEKIEELSRIVINLIEGEN